MYKQGLQTMVEDLQSLSAYVLDELLASYAFAH